MSGSSFDHKSNAVDEPHLCLNLIAQPDLSRFLRYEFGFRRHDRLPGRTLRKFISRLCFLMLIHHFRQHHQFHKPFDKGGFSRPHRSYNAYINLSIGPGFNITVYIKIVHKDTPFCAVIIYAGDHLIFQQVFLRFFDVSFFVPKGKPQVLPSLGLTPHESAKRFLLLFIA